MNIEQAIKAVEKGYVAVGDALYIPDGNTALKHIILTALCEKQERENPEPLTLEQLKERVGKPVWCEMQPYYYKCGVIGEKRVSEDKKRLVIGFSYGWEWIEDITKRGKIYDHEPEEAR